MSKPSSSSQSAAPDICDIKIVTGKNKGEKNVTLKCLTNNREYSFEDDGALKELLRGALSSNNLDAGNKGFFERIINEEVHVNFSKKFTLEYSFKKAQEDKGGKYKTRLDKIVGNQGFVNGFNMVCFGILVILAIYNTAIS